MVRAKWACSVRFFLVKMSGFDRLLTKAASVMSQKIAGRARASGKVFLEVSGFDRLLTKAASVMSQKIAGRASGKVFLEVLSVALACTRPC